jgi:hypothetical protein
LGHVSPDDIVRTLGSIGGYLYKRFSACSWRRPHGDVETQQLPEF